MDISAQACDTKRGCQMLLMQLPYSVRKQAPYVYVYGMLGNRFSFEVPRDRTAVLTLEYMRGLIPYVQNKIGISKLSLNHRRRGHRQNPPIRCWTRAFTRRSSRQFTIPARSLSACQKHMPTRMRRHCETISFCNSSPDLNTQRPERLLTKAARPIFSSGTRKAISS